MNNWLEFLAEQGARLNDDRNAVNGFTDETDITPATGFVAPLPEFALIRASGEDAAAFLHNQLTNDIQNLKPGLARLAGYCTPKGRLLATSLVWREGDGFMLQLPAEIQPATRKRLQMFVLRSKVKLSATEDRVSLGLAGTAAVRALGTLFPSLPGEPYGVIQSPPGTLIRVADDGDAPRYLWIASEAAAREAWPALTKELAPAGPRAWRLGDIRAGVPRIVRATQEQFVPQMVNFELIGGVNFKKGCYPGQEIVARSQYLGKLKRRMQLARIQADEVAAGTEVFWSEDPEQPCGMVVNAEREAGGSSLALVEIKLAALESGAIRAGSATGPALEFLELPYSLEEPA